MEHPGEGGDRTPDVVVRGSAGSCIDGYKGTCGPRSDSMRHPDLCALEAADESAAVIARGPEEDLSDPLLELLVAKDVLCQPPIGLKVGAGSLGAESGTEVRAPEAGSCESPGRVLIGDRPGRGVDGDGDVSL